MHDFAYSIGKGALGLFGAAWCKVAALTQLQEQASWVLGWMVGALTMINIGMDIRKKWRSRDK